MMVRSNATQAPERIIWICGAIFAYVMRHTCNDEEDAREEKQNAVALRAHRQHQYHVADDQDEAGYEKKWR